MDPLSQGVAGVTAAQLGAPKNKLLAASLLGFFSGMAADLDVLIYSKDDPLLALEYHRHFTHSLLFIPLGALLCTLFFYFIVPFFRHRLSFGATYLYCLLGYATHALLDACTTYGTQLLWPFSKARVAWNNISIIDPLFTLPILILVFLAVVKRKKWMSRVAMMYGVCYLLLGVVQHERALSEAKKLAHTRGHEPLLVDVKPTLGNLVLWKSIYLHDGRFYSDGIRIFMGSEIYAGDSIAQLNVQQQFPWLDQNSQQAKDIERFRWLSNDFLAVDSNNENYIVDIRYSAAPNKIAGLWGIEVSKEKSADEHVTYVTIERDRQRMKKELRRLWHMFIGK